MLKYDKSQTFLIHKQNFLWHDFSSNWKLLTVIKINLIKLVYNYTQKSVKELKIIYFKISKLKLIYNII